MILHLAGSSETARALLADRLLDTHKDWRHLALEDLFEDEIPEDIDASGVFGMMVAEQVMQDELAEGHHLIVTMPFPAFLPLLREEIETEHVAVYLGNDPDPALEFDYVLDGGRHSTSDILNVLEEIASEEK